MEWCNAHDAVVSGDLSTLRQILDQQEFKQWGLILSSKENLASNRSFVPHVLHLASSLGQGGVLRCFLNFLEQVSNHPLSAFLDLQDNVGRTPLHCAIYRLRSNCISVLLEFGASLDIEDKLGYSPRFLLTTNQLINLITNQVTEYQRIPLFLAQQILPTLAYNGDFSRIDHLLDVVPTLDVSMKDSMGRTAVHEASQLGHVQVLCQLLDAGADCNAQDWRGSTPLHYAVNSKQLDCVQILLNHPDIKLDLTETSNQRSALHVAIAQKNMDVLGMFLAQDDQISLIKGNACLSSQISKNIMDHELLEFPPIVISCLRMEEVNLLMRYFAAKGDATLVETCIGCLTSTEFINSQDQTGRTVLHDATDSRHFAVVNIIVTNGADVMIQDWRGSTSLHSAAARGDAAIATALLSVNLRVVSVRNASGCTPLLLALNYKQWECARVILDHCSPADLLEVDNLGHTALHKVVLSGNDTLMKVVVHSMSQCQLSDSYADRVPWFVQSSLSLYKFHSQHLLCHVVISKLRLYYFGELSQSSRSQFASSLFLHEFVHAHDESSISHWRQLLKAKSLFELQRIIIELDQCLILRYSKQHWDYLHELIRECVGLDKTSQEWDVTQLKILLKKVTDSYLVVVKPNSLQKGNRTGVSVVEDDMNVPQQLLPTLLRKLPSIPAITNTQNEEIKKTIPVIQRSFSEMIAGLSSESNQLLCQILLLASRKGLWQLLLWESNCQWLAQVWYYSLKLFDCSAGKLLVEVVKRSLSSDLQSLTILFESAMSAILKNQKLLPAYEYVLCEALSAVGTICFQYVPLIARFCAPFVGKAFQKLCSHGIFCLTRPVIVKDTGEDLALSEAIVHEEQMSNVVSSSRIACSIFSSLVSAAVHNQSSLLHEASSQGLADLCASLLNGKLCCPFIDINAKDIQGLTSLDRALGNGHSRVALVLLAYGATRGGTDDKNCLLSTLCNALAARDNRDEFLPSLRELIGRCDINVNGCDLKLGSPLYTVVSRHWIGGAQALLDGGADPLSLSDTNKRRNPLIYAIRRQNNLMSMLLVEYIVKLASVTSTTDSKLEAAIHEVFALTLRNGQLDIVEVLLKQFKIPEKEFAVKQLPQVFCKSLSSSTSTQLKGLVYQFFDFLFNSRTFVKQRLHYCHLMLQWAPCILHGCESTLKVTLQSVQFSSLSAFKLLKCLQCTLASEIASTFQAQEPEPPPLSLYHELQASYQRKLKDYALRQRRVEPLRVSKWSCLHEAATQGWLSEVVTLLKLLQTDAVNAVDVLGRTPLCVGAAMLNHTVVAELIGGNAAILGGDCSPIVLCIVKTVLTQLKPSRFYRLVKLFVEGSADFTAVAGKAFWDFKHHFGRASDLRRLLVYAALWKKYSQLLQGLQISHSEPGSWEAMATVIEMLIKHVALSPQSETVLMQEEVDLIAIAAAASANKALGNILATHASPQQLKRLLKWTVSLQDVVDSVGLGYRNSPRYSAAITVEVGAIDVACLYCPGQVNRNVNQESQAVDAERSALFLLQFGCVLSYPWLAAQKCYWNLIQQYLKIEAVQWPARLIQSNNDCHQNEEAQLFGLWQVVASAVTEGEISIVSAAIDAGCPDIIVSAENWAARQSLLNVAVKSHRLSVVRHLLQQGCNPLVKLPVQPSLSRKLEQVGVNQTKATLSPFHWAVQFGDVDLVAILLASMGDAFEALQRAEQCTGIPREVVFQMAARSGNRAVVQLLSDLIGTSGALVGSHMTDQAVKLELAAGVHGNHFYGWFKMLMKLNTTDDPQRIKEHNISVYQPYFRLSHCSNSCFLPSLLESACQFNQSTIVDAIQRVLGSVEFAQRTGGLIGVVAKYGYNELLLYILDCWKKNKNFKQLVTDNIDRRDVRGYTPLAWAVFEKHDRCAEILVEHGADVSWVHAKSGVGLLHLACMSGSLKIVKIVLRYLPESMRHLTDKAGLDAVCYASGYGNASLLCALYGKKDENFLLPGPTEITVTREQKYFFLIAAGWFKELMMKNMLHKQRSVAKWPSMNHFMVRSETPFCLSWKKGLVVADVWKAALDSCHYDVIEVMYTSSFGQIVSLSNNYASLLKHHLDEGLIVSLIVRSPVSPETLLKYSTLGTERNLILLYNNSAKEIMSGRGLAFKLALNAAVRGQVSVVMHLVQAMKAAMADPSLDDYTLAENAMAFGHRSESAFLSLMARMTKTTDQQEFSSAFMYWRSAIPLKLQWLLGLQSPQQSWSLHYFTEKHQRRKRTIMPSTLFLSCCWTSPELQCIQRSAAQFRGRKFFPMSLQGITVDVDWSSFEKNIEIIRQSFGFGQLLSTELLLHALVLSDFVLGVVAKDISSNPQNRRNSVIYFGTKPWATGNDGFSHYFISIIGHDKTWRVAVDIKRAVAKRPTISLQLSVDETLRELCRKTAQELERFLEQQMFVSLATASLSGVRKDVLCFLYPSSTCKGLGGFCQYVEDCSQLYADIQSLTPRMKRNTQCLHHILFINASIHAVDTVSIRYVPGLSGIDSESIKTLVNPRAGRLVWPFDVCDGKLFCLPDLFPWMSFLQKWRIVLLHLVNALRQLHSVVDSSRNGDIHIVVDWESFGNMLVTLKGTKRLAWGLDAVFRSVATWCAPGARLPFKDRYHQITCEVLNRITTIQVRSCTILDEVNVSLSSGILTVNFLLQEGSNLQEDRSELIGYYPFEDFTVVIPEAACLAKALFHNNCDMVGYDMIDVSLRRLEGLLQNQFDVKIDRVSYDAGASLDVTKYCGAYSSLLDGTGNQNLRSAICQITSAIVRKDESGFRRWAEINGRRMLRVSAIRYHDNLWFIPFLLVEMPQLLSLPRSDEYALCRAVYSMSRTKRMAVWIPITDVLGNSNILVRLCRFSAVEMEALLEYLEMHSQFGSHECVVLIEQLRNELSCLSSQAMGLPQRDRRLPGIIIFDDSVTAWTVEKPWALSTLLQKMQLTVVPHMDSNDDSTTSYAWLESYGDERKLHWPLITEKREKFEFCNLKGIDKHSGISLHDLEVLASCEDRLRRLLQSESLQVSLRTEGIAKDFHSLCIASHLDALCGVVELVLQGCFNRPLQCKLEKAGLSRVAPPLLLSNVVRAVDIILEDSEDATRNVELSDGTLIIRLTIESVLGTDGSRIELPLRTEVEEILKNAWLESCRRLLASKLKKRLLPRFLGCLKSSLAGQVSDSGVIFNVRQSIGKDFVCSLEPPQVEGHLLEAPVEDMLDRMRIEDLLSLASSRGQRWLFALSSALEMVISCGGYYRAGQCLNWCSRVKLNIGYCSSPDPVISVMPSGLLEFAVQMNCLALQPTARAIATKLLESGQNHQRTVSRPLLRSLRPSPQHSHIDFTSSTGIFFSSVGQEAIFKIIISSASGHTLGGPLEGVEIAIKVYKVPMNKNKEKNTVSHSVNWSWQRGTILATWRPLERGWYRIHIKLNGEHIKHSPCRSFVYSDCTQCSPSTKFGTGVRCVTAGSQLRFVATYDHRSQPSTYRFRYPVQSRQLRRLSAINLLHHMHQKLADYICVTSGELDVWISSGVTLTSKIETPLPQLKVIPLSEGVYYVVVTLYVASSVKLMAVLSQTQQPLSIHFVDGSDQWNCLSMAFVLPGSVCPNKSVIRATTEPKKRLGLTRKRSVKKDRRLPQRVKSPVILCTAGEEVEFLLDAFDAFGNEHTIGGSVSKVSIKRGCRTSSHTEISDLECKVTDLKNGTYVICAIPTSAGINEVLLNGVSMVGQTIKVVGALVHAPECELLTGNVSTDWSVGKRKQMFVQLKDQFGNTVRYSKDTGLAEVHLNGEACVIQRDKKSDMLSLLVTPRIAGRQTLVVKVCGDHVKNSPYILNISYGDVLRKRKLLKKSLDRLYSGHSLSRRTLLLRREHMFADSFDVFRDLSGKDLYQPLRIAFDREMGVDIGGLRKEFYHQISWEVFNEGYALFRRCESGLFCPNPGSFANPNHLPFFSFVGKICAKAICDDCYINAHFTPAVYKYILGLPCELADLELDDASLFRSLSLITEAEAPDVLEGLTFTVSKDVYGEVREVELIPGGKAIFVTSENKSEYVQRTLSWHLIESVREQLGAFRAGFCSLIPRGLIESFSADELTRMLCGQVTIDMTYLKNHTQYRRYNTQSAQIQWLWTFLEESSDVFRSTFLQFVTGSGRLPLQGSDWFITIEQWMTVEELPRASTCTNTLYLPAYLSLDVLKERLTVAVSEGHQGFQMA
jgi:ankyrin repeat protein